MSVCVIPTSLFCQHDVTFQMDYEVTLLDEIKF